MSSRARQRGFAHALGNAARGTAGRLAVAVGLAVGVVTVAAWNGERAASEHPPAAAVLAAYAGLPVTFVQNRGQKDPRVRYYAQGSRYAFYFTREEIVLSFARERSTRGVALALRFLGADPDAVPAGAQRAPGVVNYLRGSDRAHWRTGLPTYSRIVYRELWPGIDLMLHARGGQLKYEFRVRAGARPENIRLAYAGADGLVLDGAGGLLIETPLGALRDSPPVSYQEIDGVRVPVESRYVLKGAEYGFAVGAGYRRDRELVIDPGLDYSTFLGGTSHERADGIAVDSSGNAYVVGTTQSSDFPTTPGAFDREFAGGVVDVFVSKLSADGSALVYSTYLGGTPTVLAKGTGDPIEFGRGIVVDADGHAYVTGQTASDDFPTTPGAFDRTINATDRNATDGFVTKLSPDGSGLVYSTFLGGTDLDDPDGIALDEAGNAYVTGMTVSGDFPTTTGVVQTTNNGGQDAFLTKLNAEGSALVYSTYLGGADNELATSVVVDADGNAFLAGATRSADFPTTAGSFDPTHNGGDFAELFDAFVAKLSPDASALVYSTFLGGSDIDRADGLAVDSAGNAYVSGGTLSPEFPTTAGAFDTVFDGTSEGFAAKLDTTGSGLAYSTFLGGGGGAALALAGDANAWVTGGAGADAPTTADAFDTTHNGGTDAWVGRLSADGSALEHATFLGGSNSESGADLALDAAGNVYVTGTTYSPDFPTTAGAFDTVFDGDPSIFWGDAFVSKLGDGDDTTSPTPEPERTTTSFSGEIDKEQTIAHTVSVGEVGEVDLALDWAESRANLTLRVLDPSGAVVFSDGSDAKPKSGTFSAAVTGDYRFEVVNATDRQTDYTLSVTYPVASSTSDTTAALSALELDPTSVTGGTSSTGTVTLTAAAPAGGVSVALASSDTAVATVPASVTVAEGSTSASFAVSTSEVGSDTSVTISGTFDGTTRTATLAVTAATASTDSVSISRAEYDGGKEELRVEASSSSSSATLTVYVTATDELIGTLSGGKGQFSWPTNPENITVKSSLGGSATADVILK